MPSENRNISDLTRSFLFQKGIIETVRYNRRRIQGGLDCQTPAQYAKAI